jgi:hypothetical protein
VAGKLVASSIYSRVLQKAAELLGGRSKLCRHLHVPKEDLQRWIDDKAVPPNNVFLRAVDLLLDETPSPPTSDSIDPPAPRDCAPADDNSSPYFWD